MAEGPGRMAASGFPARLDLDEEVIRITRTLEDAGYETWAVGGALRDRLLGAVEQGDVDLATAAPPDVVQRLFRQTVAVGLRYGTVGVLDRRRRLHEVTTFRQDVETDGRHAVVRYGVSLREDLARRDFTINAIAYHPLHQQWEDPFRGREDLQHGVVRAVGDPAGRFREDYLRILRALRFAARFRFAIAEDTWRAAVEASDGLATLSAERVRDEWFKGLRTAQSLTHLVRLWAEVGAAPLWLPSLQVTWQGTDAPTGERDPVVLTAVACAEPAAVLERLRASRVEISRARAMAAGPRAPADVTARGVRHWLHQVGPAADDLIQLADLRGGPPPWAALVEEVRRRGEATTRADLAVTGTDLMTEGVAPGRDMGDILERLLQVVLDDPARNTRESLISLVRGWR